MPEPQYIEALVKMLKEIERQSLLIIIEEIEKDHFRTNEDTGANLNALLIWNIIRGKAGLPRLRKDDLPAYCVTCGYYHQDPHQRVKDC